VGNSNRGNTDPEKDRNPPLPQGLKMQDWMIIECD
jgi:hypothetical protein